MKQKFIAFLVGGLFLIPWFGIPGAAFGEDISHEINMIISKQADIPLDKIRPESRLIEDLYLDELALTEINLALEDKFGMDIPDADSDKFKTVGDIVNYILGRKQPKAETKAEATPEPTAEPAPEPTPEPTAEPASETTPH